MPRLSDSMEEGLIVAWLVEEGTQVSQGDDLVEIETDKANMTFEADGEGTVHFVAQEGDSLPVGAPIAQFLGLGEEPITGSAGEVSSNLPAQPDHGQAEDSLSPLSPSPAVTTLNGGAESPQESVLAPPSGSSESVQGRPKASPLARRLASDRNIPIETLTGSGPGGRIVKSDVERAADRPAPSKASSTSSGGKGEVETLGLSRLQQVVARRMSESKATIPHFYLSTDVNMSACHAARVRLKQAQKDDRPVPSFNDMVVKASALALKAYPKANGAYRGEAFELYSRVNVGVAVATEGGLVVPVVPDADQLGLNDISAKTRELSRKVREGSITPPELSGGTFTVSNLGMFGVTDFSAVVNPGQAAILAVGSIEERPIVMNGELVPGRVMSMTLSCDHRILYGSEGAEFLALVKSNLEEPMRLAL